MSSLSRELVFLILQFLDEEKFKETVHKLEQESGFFFNMKYFEDEVHNGNWDEVEKYLSGFTKVDDNRYSMKIFFEIRKQKYLEALDNLYFDFHRRHDRSKAVEILVKDLKVFASFNEELFKEITQLLTLENFRENEQLSKYGDTKSARAIMLVELKKLIEANPLFRDKLQFPNLKNSRLRTLINQSLNWQHQLCKNPRPNPDIKTLFVDHSCGQPNGARAPSPANNPLLGSLPKAGGFPPLGAHGVCILSISQYGYSVSRLFCDYFASLLCVKPFQPTPAPVPTPLAGWMSNPPAVSHPAVSGSAIGLGGPSIPAALKHPRTPNNPSLDFPSGDSDHLSKRTRSMGLTDEVCDTYSITYQLYAALVKDPGVSVNRVIWSQDGSLFVNDLAFSHPNKQLCVITCGDDKTIKVWDAATGAKQYTFEGHDAPFIFSTALDGKIKAWLYDNMGSRVDYEAPGRWCTTMAYSADGTRLEWNESEGAVKRAYLGFRKRSLGVVQFDTTKNRFLAAGDDFCIKYWDMDNVQLLTSVEADGGLPASPRIRFNKDGTLLAVSANENGIKILANSDGLRLLRTFENLSYDGASRAPEAPKPTLNTISAAAAAASGAGLVERVASVGSISGLNGDTRSMVDVKPRITEEPNDKSKIWKLTEISNAILALASNAIHLLWKWQRSERNSSGKATAGVSPQLWQPSSGILMTNEFTETNPEESVACFALSKNDSYTMTTFMPPPPAATFLAFHPQDNNIIAIGMDDSTIQIYNVRVDEVKSKLKGHSKRITGLAFSHVLNVLVSSGADAQLCVWSSDGWEKQKARYLQLPPGRTPTAQSDTRVQFHHDQIHFLVVHETQLAIYETTKLECVKQWLARESSAPISHAMFSCDSQLVYASFLDATVCVFTASHLHGIVHVFEPLESEGKWGVPPPTENGSTSNIAAASVGGSGAEQSQR
ncbi:CTLH, C-terminal LisH motif-containing protein [Cynara cardunculus var. scolymus]|uniref:CTLH, C-terminal LisH motif-containing protein n=1 Tax=Cynara cardunculus var. scolymus TaxID=59895 RepID=A0A103XYD3_CYNCS|nr:CTLH, C-terminal LisH motif-containing protein [Cynara cardunculus var. scolymus]